MDQAVLSCTNRRPVTNPAKSWSHGRLLLGVATLGAALVGACGKHGMDDLTSLDGGPISGEPWADDLLSDFEDTTAAIVLRLGWPPRNGFWYSYNDASRTCMQTPKPASQAVAAGAKPTTYVGATPPTASTGPSGARALRAQWKGCSTTGAGIAADFNAGMNLDGTLYTGPKVAYDIHSWAGVTFWAMSTGTARRQHARQPPDALDAATSGRRNCDEADAGVGKCGDHWGAPVTLPAGKWTQILVRISDAAFRQQGSGAATPWDPTQVTGVQIQSADVGQTYDFWIDDVYLLR